MFKILHGWMDLVRFAGLTRGCVILLVMGSAVCAQAQEQDESTAVVAYDLREGVVGEVKPGAGIVATADAGWVIGGMDAQGRPVVDGTWVDGQGVAKAFELDQPVSFASVAVDGERVIVAGGLAADGLTDRVVSLTWSGEGVVEVELPTLPAAVAMAGAAVVRGDMYVVGGVNNIEALAASPALYRLNLGDDDATWETLEHYPGGGVIEPTVIGFYDQVNVFGGYSVSGDASGEALHAGVASWCYRPRPIDGTKKTGWLELEDVPLPIAGAVGHQTGQAHALIIGGYVGPASFDRLLTQDQAITRSERSLIFHAITDTWVEGGALPGPLGRAGVLTIADETVLLSGDLSDDAGASAAWGFNIRSSVRQLGGLDYSVITVYFILVAGIGVWFARRQTNSDEFALGGRNVKWWAAGISMFATGASSISFMAIPAQSFRTNLVWFAPLVFFIVPMFLLQAYIIYPLLRRLRLTSTYEYLEQRFNNSLRVLASFQSVTFQLFGRMSVVMLLPSLAISAVTGLDVFVSVALMGLLTTVYTAVGGFEAVIWTDVTQGILMMFGCILMVILALTGLPGGVSEFVATSVEYEMFNFAIWDMDWTLPIIWIAILSMLMTNLGFAADQPTVQRVYATPLKDMRKLAAMFAVCSLVIAGLVNFTGISLFSYFQANPTQLDPTMSNDQIVPLYVVQRLPAGLAGLIVAALFAASMSTLSSSMNSVATLVSEDFYRRYFKNTTDRSRLILMKFASLGAGLFGTGVALYMASMNIMSMFQTWNEICALLGGGFIGIYILGMFTKRTNSTGAFVGAIASVIAAIVVKKYTNVHWLFYGPAAVSACLVFGYLTSLVTPSRPRDLKGLTVFTQTHELTDEELLADEPQSA